MMIQVIHSNSLRLSVVVLLLLAFIFLLYLPYRRDIRDAYGHLESLERQIVETDCGPIEAAIRGEGEPVLVIHGISGGFDQGVGISQSSLGDGYKVIAPSRFGYLGTPMPANATPAIQADTYVCLLDALHLEKVTVVANSAGGTSALQMALRHPDRVKALIFISTAAPTVGEYITLPPKPVIQFVFNSDFLMWGITTHFQQLMKPAMGVPESYPLSDMEKVQVSDMIRSVLPIKLRTAGFVFDMFTSNVDMDQHPADYPVEAIRIPTLIIHAVDDSLASYENAKALAERISNAELLSVPSGGHLLLGSDETVRSEIALFLSSVQ
jgi:pimeloyl-ACP methyl ester carboxylesterase